MAQVGLTSFGKSCVPQTNLNTPLPPDRLYQPKYQCTFLIARYFLDLGFAESDQKRMHALAERRQNDQLTPDEEAELNAYRQVGFQIDLLKSKARRTLNVAPESPGLH